MGLSLERRFERYCDGIVDTLRHADRVRDIWTGTFRLGQMLKH